MQLHQAIEEVLDSLRSRGLESHAAQLGKLARVVPQVLAHLRGHCRRPSVEIRRQRQRGAGLARTGLIQPAVWRTQVSQDGAGPELVTLD